MDLRYRGIIVHASVKVGAWQRIQVGQIWRVASAKANTDGVDKNEAGDLRSGLDNSFERDPSAERRANNERRLIESFDQTLNIDRKDHQPM